MSKPVLLSGAALAMLAGPVAAEMNFNRIASFPVATNFAGATPDETSAEIIDVTPLPHNGCRPPKRRRV